MFIHGLGLDPASRPLYTLRNFTKDEGDGLRVVESVRKAYPYHKDTTDHEIGQLHEAIARQREINPDTKLGALVAQEGMNPDVADTLMLRTQHIAMLDGYSFPAYKTWESWVQSPAVAPTDMELMKTARVTKPADFKKYQSPREQMDFDEIKDVAGPEYRVAFYRQGYEFDWEMMTIANLAQLFSDRFNDGEAAARTVARFVYQDWMELPANGTSNTTLQIDGATLNMFSTTEQTGGQGRQANKITGAIPSATSIEAALTLFGAMTMDGQPMPVQAARVVCKTHGAAHFDLLTLFSSALKPGTANNDRNIFATDAGNFRLTIEDTPLIDSGTFWAITADYSRAPSLGLELGFLNGQSSPSMVTEDTTFDTRLTRRRRQVIELIFGGTWRDIAGLVLCNI